MAIQFAHNTQAQLDTRNLNVYINGAQILKDVNVSIPKTRLPASSVLLVAANQLYSALSIA